MINYLLILSFLLPVAAGKAYGASTHFASNTTDTAVLIREYQNCRIYLSSGVNYRGEFTAALKQDTVIASYFRKQTAEPLIIQINNIKLDAAGSHSYVFTIFTYPQSASREEIILQVLAGASRMKYKVKTGWQFNPTRFCITDIEPADNPVEL